MYLLRHSRLASIVLSTIALSLIFGAPADGTVFETDDQVRISHLHSIDDDLFAWASGIDMDGVIDGDAFLGGNNVNVNGEVHGSLNVFAFEFTSTGVIGRSMRIFAFQADVGGDVDRSLVAMVNQFDLEADARIGRDLHVYAESASLDGHIRGNLHASGRRLTLTGRIDGDAELKADHIIIKAPATISGNLTYTAKESIEIDSVGGAVILGEVTVKAPDEGEDDGDEPASDIADIALAFSEFFAAFLFGIIILALFDQYARATYTELKGRLGVSAATGIGALLATIFCVIILAIACILFLAGRAAFSGENVILGTLVMVMSTLLIPITSFASISGAVLFYIGKIVIAMLVGCAIWQLFKKGCSPLSKLQLFVGLAVLTLLFEVPYVGVVLYFLVSMVGAGGIILGVRNCHRAKGATAEAESSSAPDASAVPGDSKRDNPPPPEPPAKATD